MTKQEESFFYKNLRQNNKKKLSGSRAELGPAGILVGVLVGAGLGALFGLLDPPKSPKQTIQKPPSYAELREELGEKTGIWSEDTIVAQKKKKFEISTK